MSERLPPAMIMTAGLGTRLKPFTDFLPKPLLPVMGIPIVQFAMDQIAAAGIDHVVANFHHLPEVCSDGLRALDVGATKLTLSDESSELMGSAGGLLQALPFLGEGPYFLVNGDVICDVDLRALYHKHLELKRTNNVLLTLAVLTKAPGLGTYREILPHVGDGARNLIGGLGAHVCGGALYTGVAVIEKAALAHVAPMQPAEFVPTILEPAIAQSRAGMHWIEKSNWIDVGSPELWLDAHLKLIESLQTQALSSRWKSRILSINESPSSGIWCDKRSDWSAKTSAWTAPCYGSHRDLSGVLQKPPGPFGPRAVLYGSAPQDVGRLQSGIGFNGVWKSCAKP